jgi:hypothetical protein
MTIYLVSIRVETGVRLEAVSAESAIGAAETVNRRKRDAGGTVYSVEPEDRSEAIIDITVD